MIDCPYLEPNGICRVASELAGADAPTNLSACEYCTALPNARQVNRVTVSLSLKVTKGTPAARGILKTHGKLLKSEGRSIGTGTQEYEGTGTELKTILAWFGQLASGSCKCTQRAVVMDKEGPDWCEQNLEMIVDWLMEEWNERDLSLADFLPVRMRRLVRGPASLLPERTIAERGARWAVKTAIRRARKKQQSQPRQYRFANLESLQPMEYLTLCQLTADTRSLIPRLPPDIAGIVGVPRSGMIPASILATMLTLPLYEVDREGNIRELGGGARTQGLHKKPGRLLVVDDSSWTGNEQRRLRQQLGGGHLYAVVYCRSTVQDKPDLAAREIDWHFFEWNLYSSALTPYIGFDLDGVLCENLPPGADADPDTYAGAVCDAVPLHLPRRTPVPLVITARPESLREPTERWMERWGVKAEKLVMWPGELGDRTGETVAAWKAQQFKDSGLQMFIESEPSLAAAIHRAAGRPVLCVANGEVYQ